MTTPTVKHVMDLMEAIAPVWMACDGDPVGLHVGDPARRVKRILVTLDATLGAVQAAKARKCQMIVAHHPRLYRPLKDVNEAGPMGRLLSDAIRARLAIYCAHTNLDAAPGGVNDTLADLVGLIETRPVHAAARDPLYKLVVFVPESHLRAVREAICDAGAGLIGDYADCTFRTPGIGSFRGGDTTSPFIGKRGAYEEVEEWRLEALLPESCRDAALGAMQQAHPYEEPAYDLYRLATHDSAGLGRHGPLKRPAQLGTLARRLKKACRAPGVRVLGDRKARIRRAAVWSGGGCPVHLLKKELVDAVVLGEIGYHDTEVLQQEGVACIALGHAPSEEIVLPRLAESLREGLPGTEVHLYNEGTPKMWSV